MSSAVRSIYLSSIANCLITAYHVGLTEGSVHSRDYTKIDASQQLKAWSSRQVLKEDSFQFRYAQYMTENDLRLTQSLSSQMIPCFTPKHIVCRSPVDLDQRLGPHLQFEPYCHTHPLCLSHCSGLRFDNIVLERRSLATPKKCV